MDELLRQKLRKYVIRGVDSGRSMELNIDAQINKELKESPIDTDKVLGLLNQSLADTRKLLATLIKDLRADQ